MQPNNHNLIQVSTLDSGFELISICQIQTIRIFKGWVRFTTQYKNEKWTREKYRVTHETYLANNYWLDGIKTIKQGVTL